MSNPFQALANPLRCTFNSVHAYWERRRITEDLRGLDSNFLKDAGLSRIGNDDLRRLFL